MLSGVQLVPGFVTASIWVMNLVIVCSLLILPEQQAVKIYIMSPVLQWMQILFSINPLADRQQYTGKIQVYIFNVMFKKLIYILYSVSQFLLMMLICYAFMDHEYSTG